MIISKAFDVEVTKNFFSITFIDVRDYLKVFADCCVVNKKGKETPVPLVEVLSVSEIKRRLDTVDNDVFYITDKDDEQLFPLIKYLNDMYPKDINGKPVIYDCFAYNNLSYDDIMIAGFLSNCNRFNTTKELITFLYDLSKKIIKGQENRELFKNDYLFRTLKRFKLPYRSVDLMRVFALNKVGSMIGKDGKKAYIPKGLKQTSINLKWYELLEYEMPPITEKDADIYRNIKSDIGYTYRGYTVEQLNELIEVWDRYILDEYIPDMLHYNKNDVFIVCEMIRLYMEEIRLRYSISFSYKVNVLSSSRSNMADVLFEKFYSEFSGLHPSEWKGKQTLRTAMSFKKAIFSFIEFKTPKMKAFLEDVKKVIVYKTDKSAFEKSVTIGNTVYTMAMGGLHSQDLPRALYSKLDDTIKSFTGEITLDDIKDNDYVYVHEDVASFYPSIMSSYKIAPKHLNEYVFVKLVTWLKDTRVQAKHSKEEYINGIHKDVLAQALKIVINSIYGKFGSETGVLFDRMCTIRVTINGQLMALMLCEELELNGIEVVSANTDGIVVKLYGHQVKLYKDIVSRWRDKTKMGTDSELYFAYINRDINNYIAYETNGKITYKGALNPKMYAVDLSKGYNMPIVAKAVSNYFLEHKPIMDSLMECKDILDFCKTQNIGRGWHVEETSVQDSQIVTTKSQRYVRYYVSNYGVVIEKVNNTSNSTRSRLSAGQYVTVLNTLDDKDISVRDINYKYYYEECLKIKNSIMLGISPKGKGRKQIKKMNGMWNTLFD